MASITPITKLTYQDYVCYPDDGKRQIYQRAGVGEYWIVDSQERTLLQLILRDGQYAEQPHDDTVALSVVADVSVELSQVW